jgi:RNA polymerase sigma-70 factor (ECF subfamily)
MRPGGTSAADCECVRASALHARVGLLLLRVARDRDRAAFADLFRLCAPLCKSWYLARGAIDAVAEDLVQEAMVAVWTLAPGCELEAEGGALAWLFRVVRDEWTRAGGPADRGERPAASGSTPNPGPDAGMEGAERARVLMHTFRSLPPDEQAVLRDVFVSGLSHRLVAERRGLPLGTVKWRLSRALKILRRDMGREE